MVSISERSQISIGRMSQLGHTYPDETRIRRGSYQISVNDRLQPDGSGVMHFMAYTTDWPGMSYKVGLGRNLDAFFVCAFVTYDRGRNYTGLKIMNPKAKPPRSSSHLFAKLNFGCESRSRSLGVYYALDPDNSSRALIKAILETTRKGKSRIERPLSQDEIVLAIKESKGRIPYRIDVLPTLDRLLFTPEITAEELKSAPLVASNATTIVVDNPF